MDLRTMLLAVALLAPAVPGARAQPRLDELVEADPFSDDPIGVDARSDLRRVPVEPPADPAEDPAVVASRGPRPPEVAPAPGNVLSAIPGVRETDHEVDVRLSDGLAEVETRMRFRNGARHRAEVAYRLRVPEGTEIAALEVCVEDRCRQGVPDPSTGALSAYDDAVRARPPEGVRAPLPVAHVRREQAEDGPALSVRAAPIEANDGELRVTVRYVAPARVAGGVVRLALPARGRDPRVAPAAIRVTADDLLAPSVDGRPATARPVQVEPWFDALITARLATGYGPKASAEHFPCGAGRCARVRLAAGPRTARPADLVLLIDASPSMEGPARGRVGAAVAALLASAPPGSRVRGAAFAARAEAIGDAWTPVDRARLAPFARAALRDLGAATRFESAWRLIAPWFSSGSDANEKRVVIVGDGGLLRSEEGRAAFAAARRAGVEVSVLNLADRATWDALAEGARATGGVVVRAGAAAEDAARGRGTAALEEAVAGIFAPVVARRVVVGAGGRTIRLGALRAGEDLVWVGELGRRGARARVAGGGARAASRPADALRAHALAAMAARAEGQTNVQTALVAVDAADLHGDPPDLRCDPLGPPRVASGVSDDAAPVAPAHPRRCTEPPAAGAEPPRDVTALPEHTVLSMLRQRVLPVARRCFRRDRAGRPDYSVRATFEFRLADREVVQADVRGRIDDALRACLLDAVHELDVPPFQSTVVVRYPVYTAPEPRPPTIALEPEVARRVDRAIGDD